MIQQLFSSHTWESWDPGLIALGQCQQQETKQKGVVKVVGIYEDMPLTSWRHPVKEGQRHLQTPKSGCKCIIGEEKLSRIDFSAEKTSQT
jgi:hypothetical protein